MAVWACYRDLDWGGGLGTAVDNTGNYHALLAGILPLLLPVGDLPFPSMSAVRSKWVMKLSATLSSQTVCHMPLQGV
jgi:hypothetical protein